ncbi:uncharacterized protein LOC106092543 [Stomoxys calcitrans]|uniref:uncharacterized protein LOC106092543 n=1 Tax=Stomoxys calcitrans TaxID=35570 RepID=UPI0027E2D80D|nr:uncharacterized protein LOC106092543 [Stomoxys calcitrans]
MVSATIPQHFPVNYFEFYNPVFFLYWSLVAMDKEKIKFNQEEKRLLIECIKAYPIIWDKNHPGHSNRRFIKFAWMNVEKQMNINEYACRVAWKSICDSRRYYRRKANKSESQSLPEGGYSSEDEFAKQPPFEDEMKFMDETISESSANRLATHSNMNEISTKQSSSPHSPGMRMHSTMNEISRKHSISPYSYRSNSPNSSTQQTNCLSESMFDVVEIMEYPEPKLEHKYFPENHEAPRNVDNASHPWSGKTNGLKKRKTEETDNKAFLTHLDSILNKLTLSSSEGLQAKIMTLAYEELAKHRGS